MFLYIVRAYQYMANGKRVRMKKLLAVAACAAMTLGVLAAPIHAASGINKAEQEILDFMEKGILIQGETLSYGKNTDVYAAVEDYFNTDGVDISQEAVDTVKTSAKNTQAFLEKYWDQTMTPELVQEMLDTMQPGVNALGVKVAYDVTTDELIFMTVDGQVIHKVPNFIYEDGEDTEEPTKPGPTIKDKTKTEPKLENTGEDFSSTYAIFGSLAVILAGAGIVASRKKTVKE